jgi:hypothetical protein
MKLDPGMHIDMHLVSFGKSGVTYRYHPLDLDPISFYCSQFRNVRALTSRSTDLVDRTRASVAFEPAVPLLLVSADWLVHVSLKGHRFYS